MKTTKYGKIAAIAAAAAAVVGIGVFGAVKLTAKDPKETVIHAFETIYTEDQVNPAEELFGISKFAENAGKISQQSGFRLVLDDCSEEEILQTAAGAGLRAEVRTDLEAEKYSLDLSAIFQNMDLLTANFYYGDDTFQAAIPELSRKAFTIDLSEGLSERVKQSPVIGPALEENGIDVEAIQEYIENVKEQAQENGSSDPYGIKDLLQRYKDGCQAKKNFEATMTVEKADRAGFQMDGSEVSCQGYQVHISKASMIDFLRTSSDFFLQDEELKENYLKQLQLTASLMALTGNQVEIPSAKEMLDENYEQVQETVDELLRQMETSLNDVDMLVYVDKKGRLAAVNGSTVINSGTDASGNGESTDGANASGNGESADGADASVLLKFDVRLQGGTYLTQNLTAELQLSNAAASDGAGDTAGSAAADAAGNAAGAGAAGMAADTMTFSLTKNGTYDSNQWTNSLSAGLQISNGNNGSFSYDSTYAADSGDYRIYAELSADTYGKTGIELTGIMDELEKGESVHLTIDKLQGSFYSDETEEEGSFTLSGEYYYGPLKDEVTVPEGEAFDVIGADEQDWQGVMMEAGLRAFALMSSLGLPLSY